MAHGCVRIQEVQQVIPYSMPRALRLAQSECVYDPWRSEYRVVAAEAARPRQEVLIDYGSQSNDALLQRYGFVEDSNPHDR